MNGAKYERSTTRSRREANKPRFVHYSKWIDVVPDADGEPEYRVHFKTKVLTPPEAQEKLEKRKWFRIFLRPPQTSEGATE